jgi:predicted nucleic-acid-binding protein
VLESVYEVGRTEILATINDLLQMPVLKIACLTAVQAFLNSARTNKIDLSDLLIGHCAKLSGCESVLTFDKKASKTALFQRLV